LADFEAIPNTSSTVSSNAATASRTFVNVVLFPIAERPRLVCSAVRSVF
jgi:hypothetical protein